MNLLRIFTSACLIILSAPACSQAKPLLAGMACSTEAAGGSQTAMGHSGDFDYAVRVRDEGDWVGLIACVNNAPLPPPLQTAGAPELPRVHAKDRILLLLSYSPDGKELKGVRLEAPADFSLPPAMQKPASPYFLRSALQSVEGDDKGLLDSMTIQLGADPSDIFKPVSLRHNVRTEKDAFARGEVDGDLTINAEDCAVPASHALCEAVQRLAATSGKLHVEYRTRDGSTVMAGDIPVSGLPQAATAAAAALAKLKSP